MELYLGLGSNLGDRRTNLSIALDRLQEFELTVKRISPVIESPALLPENSPAEWDTPFLNLAAECETQASPETIKNWIDEIEHALGRTSGPRWAPRPVDIDILLWGNSILETERLTIPHRDIKKRNFVLTPMVALKPRLVLPGSNKESLLDCSIKLSDHIPLWMGVLNVTPDSFSDGGSFLELKSIEPHIQKMIEAGVHVIDVGGESTRPQGSRITTETEWKRVAPVLERLIEIRDQLTFGPLISIDTYHVTTAKRALGLGVDIVNDVSGLRSPEMIDLAAESTADFIAMHQMSLPADPAITIPQDSDPYGFVESWLDESIELWDKCGIDLNRVLFDPGIGFGKTTNQSRKLLARAGEFRSYGLRVVVGHSRKSFLTPTIENDTPIKDLATSGLSMNLCTQGVDIIRVHNVPMNAAVYHGWAMAANS